MSQHPNEAVFPTISAVAILSPEYGAIDVEFVAWLDGRYTTLQRLLTRTAQDLVTIGRLLAEVKGKLAPPEFLAFIAALGLSRATAYRWMRAAEVTSGCSQVENIEPSALYALAAKSTPEEVRESYLQRADAGHRVTAQEVQTTLRQHRPHKPQPAPNTVERIVDDIVAAEDAGAGRDWFGREVRADRIAQEITRFAEESQLDVATAVHAWGRACVVAAGPYLMDTEDETPRASSIP